MVASYPCHSKQGLLKREGSYSKHRRCKSLCGRNSFKMIQEYCNPLNEEGIKQGYERTKRNGKHKDYRDNHKEEAKEYHKGYRNLEKSKKTELKQSKK